MTTLAVASRRLELVAEGLSTTLERRALPPHASDLEPRDLSDAEAVTLALFSDASDGTTLDDREEKVALAGVLRFHAIRLGGAEPKWQKAIAAFSRTFGSERWRLGAALLLEKPSMLTPGERRHLATRKVQLRRELEVAKAIARDALGGLLPANTPHATRFANDSEIAKAKADGRVAPATLVRYGDTWFYADPRDLEDLARRRKRWSRRGVSAKPKKRRTT